jgi:hypothetical protein
MNSLRQRGKPVRLFASQQGEVTPFSETPLLLITPPLSLFLHHPTITSYHYQNYTKTTTSTKNITITTMTTRLQVSLSAQNLKNLSGYLSKSDPFAVVTVRGDNPDNRPDVVGRTDV